MKSISKIRHIQESNMILENRILKSKINEDAYSNNGQMAFNTIKKAMEGIGTDEEGVLRGVLMIKTKEDYNTALSLCQKEKIGISNYLPKTIMEYISSDMTYEKLKSNNFRGMFSNDGQVALVDLLTNQPKDQRLLENMSDHLTKFNQYETIIRT
jgi:hypothetical protein